MYVRTCFYGAKLMKIIYKTGIAKSATQGLPFHHLIRFKSIKKQKSINHTLILFAIIFIFFK
jgi:hypothetical protein